MKNKFLYLFFVIFLFGCPQQNKTSSDKTSTQTQVYTLDVQVSPLGSGVVSVNPESSGRKYLSDTIVTLEAQPNQGWKFSYWSGDITSSTNPIVVVMNSNKTIVANFVQIQQSTYTPTYTLLTFINPQNAGTITKLPDQTSYPLGSQVTLQAVSATGYVFVSWSGDVPSNLQNQNPITITIDGNKQITANFEEIPQGNYTLEVFIDPPDGGEVVKNPNKTYYSLNETVSLEAIPNEGFYFEGWSGNLTGSQNPATVTITGNLRITANFSRSQYKLNITVNPPNTGVVNKNPNYQWYYPNTEVELQAVPLEGYKFTSWSGDIQSTSNPITIFMDSDKNITANFEEMPQEEYLLVIQLVPSTASALWVEKSPDKPFYAYGEKVSLTANPPSGWRFVRWRIDNVDYTDNPLIITIISNTTVTAYFERI